MDTRSIHALCTVAEHEDFHTVALYSSQELDALTEQLQAIATEDRGPRSVARGQWQQLALACCELTAQLEAGLARIEARVGPSCLARPSRAQRRVLVRLVRVGPLDPRCEDDAAWLDGQVLRAMQRRRWVKCNLYGEWRVTPYGEHALARVEARDREAAHIQFTLIRGGAQ